MSGDLSLRYWPNPTLSTPAGDSVSDFGEHLLAFGNQMIELMLAAQGEGLAAPQVGVLTRLFVMQFENASCDPAAPAIICNPVLDLSDKVLYGMEGCLSLPGIFQPVLRAEEVLMTYQDWTGLERAMVLTAREARVVQHEADHLDGIMFFDRSRMSRQLSRMVTARWAREGASSIVRQEAVIRWYREANLVKKFPRQTLPAPPSSGIHSQEKYHAYGSET